MSGKGRVWLPDYKIAFTFTGEYREKIVRPACEELLKLGYREDEIFFDEWHPEIITGVNADAIFREIYHDVSQCVVVLLSPNYSDKLWTGNLEWPTVRALINEGTHHKICLLRVDDVDINKIEGLYSSRDVARTVDKMTPAQIARFIHRWYCIHILKQSPDKREAKPDSVSRVPDKRELSVIDAVEADSVSAHDQAAAVPFEKERSALDSVDAAAVQKSESEGNRVQTADNLKWLENGNVLFGCYPQTASGKKEPIEWLVLKKETNRALLISRYALDVKIYNYGYNPATWSECGLRSWLNNSIREDCFLQAAFTAEEQGQIQTADVYADRNSYLKTKPGKGTKDSVFLLSIPEAKELFSSDEARRCAPTDFAKKQGVYTNNDYKADGRPACWWWLRLPGNEAIYIPCVHYDGSVVKYGNRADSDFVGVRPALWINL